MSELRFNPVSRDWVIISTERAKRPSHFIKPAAERTPLPGRKDDCPFCPGNETAGEEIARIGDAGSWKVRIVRNKFPALCCAGSPERMINGIYNTMAGYGEHEVVIEHPRHDLTIALMTDDEVELIVRTYRDRYRELAKMKGVESITIFKNHGSAAGASIEHAHSQIIATPIVPPLLRNRVETAAHFYDFAGKCLFCQVLDQEVSEGKRVVHESDSFVTFMPYASASPFAMSIFPVEHKPCFGDITDGELRDLACHLRVVLAKLYHGLGNPDYNLTIRSVPVKEAGVEYYHWFMSLIPRISKAAGFELGSGIFINTALPEESAEFLRNAS